ncbi:uncharacterized protein LOC116851825 isoform X2 [Odontomachus brunneus]|uniref:uncharacterized protein LOC116851825 isoform X2 n=1 Tax=Odontomachus brunneus TaxID=486640 RepID=UPI0013F2A873|nr:uncharacterized protein LOC116851825 isoform X2 [Odontomachus brunneus]
MLLWNFVIKKTRGTLEAEVRPSGLKTNLSPRERRAMPCQLDRCIYASINATSEYPNCQAGSTVSHNSASRNPDSCHEMQDVGTHAAIHCRFPNVSNHLLCDICTVSKDALTYPY